METLGFSDDVSQWSDKPRVDPTRPQGRPLSSAGGSMADWAPGEVRHELDRGNLRWSLLIALAVTITALVSLGYWLYQRPTVQTEAVIAVVGAESQTVADALPVLEEYNDALLLPDPTQEPVQLSVLETAARSLFQTAGQLPPEQTAARSAAAGAAEAALDGIRLTRAAHAYRLAVAPVITTPALETDPSAIGLDEAARAFGAWQLQFDQVRSALPDQVLPEVTERMGMFSTDLAETLTAYVEALRADDMTAAETVLTGLSRRLTDLHEFLVMELDAVQGRVEQRIAETQTALTELTG